MPENPVRTAATQAVADGLQHVTIDDSGIDRTAASLAESDLSLPTWRHPALPDERDIGSETLLDYLLVANSLNFQFHNRADDGVYTRHDGPDTFTGAFGMWASVTRALERGIPITEGSYLADLDRETVTDLFDGDPPIPFLEDRVRVLRHVGERLLDLADGRFHTVVGSDGVIRPFDGGDGLVEWLGAAFPGAYGDERTLEGRRIPFLKKAQLGVALLAGRFNDGDRYDVVGLDSLTLFADYVVPAILRHRGVLQYDEALATRVDEGEPLPANSRMEVEVRAATVVAGDRLLERLADRYEVQTTAVHLDHALWRSGRDASLSFHQTATTAY